MDDQIADVAPNADLREKYPDDEVWEAPNEVLSPGFVNGHTHLYGVLAHGIPLQKAPSGFWPFLEDFWWPLVEDRLDHAMINAATDYRCATMLKSGVTIFLRLHRSPQRLARLPVLPGRSGPQMGPARDFIFRSHAARLWRKWLSWDCRKMQILSK